MLEPLARLGLSLGLGFHARICARLGLDFVFLQVHFCARISC